MQSDVYLRDDKNKTDFSLLPFSAIRQVADVYTFGATKYDRNNWIKGTSWCRVMAASLRHITDWMLGENLDQESGLHHLAHAAFGLLSLIVYYDRGIGEDDRTGV